MGKNLESEKKYMNEIFNFHGQEVRTLTIDDEPWFVGKDVADILGYQNGSRDINRHVDEEDRQNYQNGTFGNRGVTVINESGLYSLILSSKLPQAKEFKRWVTSEVLPAIRKQGGFIREDLDEDAKPVVDTKDSLKQDSVRIIEALGGPENIEEVDACITRLRVSVKDSGKVDKPTLKAIGAVDVLEVQGGIQAVYGAKAILYKNNINEILGVDD